MRTIGGDSFRSSHKQGAVPLRAMLLLACSFLALSSSPVSAQRLQRDAWSPNGVVASIVESGESIFMAGQFNHLAPPTGGAALVDPTTGVAKGPFPAVHGMVLTALDDGRGGWFVGGQFDSVQGQPRQNLAQIDASGLVTQWNPSADGGVWKLIRRGDTAYVAGEFRRIAGVGREGLAALTITNGAPLAWNPRLDGWAKDMIFSDTTLFVAGDFSQIGDSSRTSVAEIGLLGGRATGWETDLQGSVYALLRHANTLFVGGRFTLNGWTGTQENLAALDLESGREAFHAPRVNGPVYTLALKDTTLYLGGEFFSVGSTPRVRLAAQGVTTGRLLPWAPGANSTVSCLVSTPSEILVGGYFTKIADSSRTCIAALDPVSGRPSAWRCIANGSVWDMHRTGESLFLLGTFAYAGALERRNVAAISRTTGQPLAWRANTDDDVLALSCASGRVFIGGNFRWVEGVARRGLAAIDEASGQVLPWAPEPYGTVRALCATEERVAVGGDFTTIAGAPTRYFAILDARSGSEAVSTPRPNGAIRALGMAAGRVYASGLFTLIGNAPRLGLAAYSLENGTLLAWNPAPNAPALALAVAGPSVYIGGSFDLLGTTPVTTVAEVDSAVGQPTAFRTALTGTPSALAVRAGRLFVAGCSGYPLAQVDLASNALTNLGLPGPNYILALAAGKQALHLGGYHFPAESYAFRCYSKLSLDTDSLRVWPRTIAAGETTFVAVSGESLDDCEECRLVKAGTARAIPLISRGPGMARGPLVLGRADAGAWQLECRHRDSRLEPGAYTMAVLAPPANATIKVSGRTRVRRDTWTTYFVTVTGDSLRTARGRIVVPLRNIPDWKPMSQSSALTAIHDHDGLQLRSAPLTLRPREVVVVGFQVLSSPDLGSFNVLGRWVPIHQEVRP